MLCLSISGKKKSSQISQCFAKTFSFKMKHSTHFIISGQESRKGCQNVVKARAGVSSYYLKEIRCTVADRVLPGQWFMLVRLSELKAQCEH